ncbi:MAG: hypothetical protein K2H19_09545 [Ruminococcus sp.]|nr:hypothetical protein [Ruminococcus sp.]
MNRLSPTEENALKFYIGDTSGNHSFYGDKKAYLVLNSLFFPDIYTETARAYEKKYLNHEIISDTKRLLDFFEALFSVFSKSVLKENILTYRVERSADYQLCHEKSCTVSMTSTSTAGFLDSYSDRHGITLMRFSLMEGTNCIDIANTLSYYAKPEESEILLPPFMMLDIKETDLLKEEIKILDSQNNPPEISCSVKALGIEKYSGKYTDLYPEGSTAGIRVYNALNSGKLPEKSDTELYSHWKTVLQNNLHKMLSDFIPQQ